MQKKFIVASVYSKTTKDNRPYKLIKTKEGKYISDFGNGNYIPAQEVTAEIDEKKIIDQQTGEEKIYYSIHQERKTQSNPKIDEILKIVKDTNEKVSNLNALLITRKMKEEAFIPDTMGIKEILNKSGQQEVEYNEVPTLEDTPDTSEML